MPPQCFCPRRGTVTDEASDLDQVASGARMAHKEIHELPVGTERAVFIPIIVLHVSRWSKRCEGQNART